ncbi:hypothetical protein [Frigoribacterium sp. Leaf172]|uniref:hypothetical protein n=1 Tax=Frigoribacterium sp. Leaf172 TaxID=1736285 RepID=UPI0012E7A48A|nr:hypothetical protein [Frigoribacterium sp. Leaf172]
MQWWNSLVEWISSDDGWRIMSGAIIPFVAIIVAGVIAALIGRSAIKQSIARQNDVAKAAAVSGIVTAARKAAIWNSLGTEEREYSDHLAHESEVRLRLLPVSGARSAASWAEHELAEIKRHSATFSFQAEQSLADFRDRMVEWQAKPKRAKKLFRYDLERWRYEDVDADKTEGPRDHSDADRQTGRPSSAPEPARMPTPAPLVPADRAPAAGPESITVPPAAAAFARPPVVSEPRPVVAPVAADLDDAPQRDASTAPTVGAESGQPETPDASTAVQTDTETDLDPDEARFGEPVSAQQVRRRTSPDPHDD